MTAESDTTGVILVGGKSIRMGQDKAFMVVEGYPLIERILKVFDANFEKVLIIGNRKTEFSSYGLPVINDIYPGSALGGLYTGLFHATTGHIFVSPCDLPFPHGGIVRYLCRLQRGYDVVVPMTDNGLEPLFAVYSKNCLKTMRNFLLAGNYRIQEIYPLLKVRYVQYGELKELDKEGRCFLNLNSPDEFKLLGGKYKT